MVLLAGCILLLAAVKTLRRAVKDFRQAREAQRARQATQSGQLLRTVPHPLLGLEVFVVGSGRIGAALETCGPRP